MIKSNLFEIPYWSIPTLNFSEKSKKLKSLCRRHPEIKHGIQTFSTNRQSPRIQYYIRRRINYVIRKTRKENKSR